MLGVITVNVNGVRAAARKGGLAWLREQVESGAADVLCLQEVRATSEQLHEVLAAEGLDHLHVAHDSSERLGHAGVALLSTLPLRKVSHGIAEFTGIGRWVEAEIDTPAGPVTVASVYVHAGDVEKPVQQEKYRFLDAMTQRFTAAQKARKRHLLVCGDLNVAHREIDIKNAKANVKNAGFLPEERAYFDRWFDEIGVVDLGRRFAGETDGPYTWWSQRGKAFDNNVGWRIDYAVASSGLAEYLESVAVHRAEAWDQRWSDHAPMRVRFTLD